MRDIIDCLKYAGLTVSHMDNIVIIRNDGGYQQDRIPDILRSRGINDFSMTVEMDFKAGECIGNYVKIRPPKKINE